MSAWATWTVSWYVAPDIFISLVQPLSSSHKSIPATEFSNLAGPTRTLAPGGQFDNLLVIAYGPFSRQTPVPQPRLLPSMTRLRPISPSKKALTFWETRHE